MAITGIGADIVDVGRFRRALVRAPRLVERLFAECERELPVESLAVRFAAKEAVVKALGFGEGFRWRDVIVHRNAAGAPYLELSGAALDRAQASGINRWHVSLTHDGGMALAFVIAEHI
jgi:holo-[acyl-carrier protein] synthase